MGTIGGCTTTALRLGLGAHVDPAVSIKVDILAHWVYALQHLPAAALQKVWAKKAQRLQKVLFKGLEVCKLSEGAV